MAVLVTTLRSRQAVANSTLIEGRAVVVGTSGVREDLPIASYASANTTQGVYVAFFPPDNFPRPTYASMYTAPYKQTYNLNNNALYGSPTFNELQYLVPRSQWKEPSIYSGELVALHWGRVGITSSCFTNEADIRVPGNKVKVGTSGLFIHANNGTNACGEVERYDADNGVLYIILY
jgi:hypothetical protein